MNTKEILRLTAPFIITYAVILLVCGNVNWEIGFLLWFSGALLSTFHQMWHIQNPFLSVMVGGFFSWSYLWYWYKDY